MALAHRDDGTPSFRRHLSPLIILGLLGAAFVYGDGIITPAISVLSAVEGLNVATSLFNPYIVVIAVSILIGLFAVQSKGTGHIGRVFGPIMLLWFVCLAVLGVGSVIQSPRILESFSPLHGIRLLMEHPGQGFVVLGSVFLALTGAEALYADMGHFGRGPIRLGWYIVVLPSLLLQYLGQGALLLREPEAVANPFYLLAPSWLIYPLVGLATIATVIASQALLSGAFSSPSKQSIWDICLAWAFSIHPQATSDRFMCPWSIGSCSSGRSVWSCCSARRATWLPHMALPCPAPCS